MSHVCSLNGFKSKAEILPGHISPIALNRNFVPLLWLALFTPDNTVELATDDHDEKYHFLSVSISTGLKNLAKILPAPQSTFADKQIVNILKDLERNLRGSPYKFLLLDDQEIHFDSTPEEYLSARTLAVNTVRSGNFNNWHSLLDDQGVIRFDASMKSFSLTDDQANSASDLIEKCLIGEIEQDWSFMLDLKEGVTIAAPSEEQVKSYISETTRQVQPRVMGMQALIPGQRRFSKSQWEQLIRMSSPEMKDARLFWDSSVDGSYEGAWLKHLSSNGSDQKIQVRFARAQETPLGAVYNIQNPPLESSGLFSAIVEVLEAFPSVVIDRYK